MNSPSASDFKNDLSRRLGFIDAYSLVVGCIIGTGVFLKAAVVSNLVSHPYWVLLTLVVGGCLSLAGALTYAELGILFPKAGGEYAYLREGYGDLTAFLYGWQRFWIGSPGSIAAYAVGAATFASPLFDVSKVGGVSGLAAILIVIFTMINCLKVSFGGHVQSVMTALKLILIVFIAGGIFLFSDSGTFQHLHPETSSAWPGFRLFGAGLLAMLWAFDGWNNMPMVAGEIKDPSRNVPRALAFGVLSVIVVYGLAHLSYFYALPFSEVLTANSKLHPTALPVATKAAETFLGSSGFLILAGAFVLSALGAMNGSVLSSARVPYAMARDGVFFRFLGWLHPRTQTPVAALLVQAVLACLMAFSGTFDQLTDYVVFASWIFYALVAASVFILRRRLPSADRPYKTIGYPIVPAAFVLTATWLLVNTVLTSPRESLTGLAIIAIGAPVFWFVRSRATKHEA